MMTKGAALFPKYAAALMLVVGLLVVGSGALQTALTFREVRQSAALVQQAEARAAAVRIEQFLSTIQSTLTEASNLPWDSKELGAADRREEYHRLLKLLPAVAELRWSDAEGRQRMRISRFEIDEVGGSREVVSKGAVTQAVTKGSAFEKPYFRDGSEPFVTLAVRDRGRPPTVTLAEIDLKFVADVVRNIRLGERGRVYVVDSAGTLMAHPNLDLVLRKTDLSGYAPLQRLRASVDATGGGAAAMIEGEGLESGQVLVSAAAIPSVDWTVVAEQPSREVMAPVYSALARTGLLVAGGLLVALLVSYWLARRLSQPILQLRHGAGKIAQGDLSARIDVRTGDEIEALATDFNRMADQIQDYTTGLERKVEEKTAKLQEAMRARELFLAAASHDLRQPLYAISILADALALKELPDGAKEILGKQRQAIGILRTLFDNLLDLSRFEAGEIRPVLREVSVREVLNPIAVEYEVLSHAKGLAWQCDLPDAWIRTDPELLRRLVGNLLSNAVRYTNAGGVRLEAEASASHVTFVVSDTGIGIAPEHQARVFDEFVQLDNPSRERERGVGLGLSIVRKIDALLGMQLKLDSAPERGTRVSFEVPVAAVRAEPVARTEPAETAASNLPGARIWVVEDDAMVRSALSMQLDSWAVDHDFATTREEILALRDADGDWPDAVVLDDMLGQGERGLELARWLGEHMPAGRITLVTGNVEPERVRALQESGFKVLRKPVSSVVLAQALGESLESARTIRAAAPGE